MQMPSHAFNAKKRRVFTFINKKWTLPLCGHIRTLLLNAWKGRTVSLTAHPFSVFAARGEARAEQTWSARWFPFVIEPLEFESLREKQLVKILLSQTRNRGPKSNLFLPLWGSAAKNSLAARWVKFLTSADLIPVEFSYLGSRGKPSEQRWSLCFFFFI